MWHIRFSAGDVFDLCSNTCGMAQIGSLIGKNTIGIAADQNPIFLVTLDGLCPLLGLLILLISGGRSVPLLVIGIILVGSIYAASTVGSPLVVIEVFRNEKLYENLRLYMRIYVACRCSDQPSYGNGC